MAYESKRWEQTNFCDDDDDIDNDDDYVFWEPPPDLAGQNLD